MSTIIQPNVEVCITSKAKGDQLLDGFEGKHGRVSHLVGGSSLMSDPLWVVAVPRSKFERKLLFSNASESFDENTCSWMPVPQSYLEIVYRSEEEEGSIEKQIKKQCLNLQNHADQSTTIPIQTISKNVMLDYQTNILRNEKMEKHKTQTRDASNQALPPSICVIVCFRDLHIEQKRGEHLSKFVPHMKDYFKRAQSLGLCQRYKILIVEQSNDQLKFNRGKLLNIGFGTITPCSFLDLVKDDGYDAFVFHDVDLLPDDNLMTFYCTSPKPGKPIHIARVWDRYNANPSYMGGVVSWNKEDLIRINGFPNNYWGWGGEDDEMMRRCKTTWGTQFAMKFPRHGKLFDLEEMTLDKKLSFLRNHKDWKNYKKLELEQEHAQTWRQNGVNSLTYRVLSYTIREPRVESKNKPIKQQASSLSSKLKKKKIANFSDDEEDDDDDDDDDDEHEGGLLATQFNNQDEDKNVVFKDNCFMRVCVECCLNGAGQHDEWAGITFKPEY